MASLAHKPGVPTVRTKIQDDVSEIEAIQLGYRKQIVAKLSISN